MGRLAGAQPSLGREKPAHHLGCRDWHKRQVERHARLADLRRTPNRWRQNFRRHQQPGRARPQPQRRSRRGDGLFLRGRHLPLANRPSQAADRPRQRLAAAGRLLHPLRRRRPPLLRLQPRRSRMPRHRGLPRRRERRPHRRRDRHRAYQRGSDLEIRHDRRARRLPPQPRHQLASRRGRSPVRPNQQRRGRGPHPHPRSLCPQLHRPRPADRRPPLGQRPTRRPDSARPVGQPRLRRSRWPQAGDLPRRRRLGLCPRTRHRRTHLEIRLQPQRLSLGIGRPWHPQQPRLNARLLRRRGLSRRRPRPRARRRRGPPVGH